MSMNRTSTVSKKLLQHVIVPSSAPSALFALYLTPKAVFGCANRGLMALGVVLLATMLAVATTGKGVTARRHGDNEEANWWLLTTLILLSPIVLLFGPLG